MNQEQIDEFVRNLTPAQKAAVVTTLVDEFQRVYADAQAFARKVLPK